METGKYVTKENGKEIVHWDYAKKYTAEEKEQQREEFEKEAKKGKIICISDLFCTHGL